jgi:methyl-accepting chemotaxis protein
MVEDYNVKKKMKKHTKAKIYGSIDLIAVLICAILVTVGLRGANRELRELQAQQLEICLYASEFGEVSNYLTNEARSYVVTGDKKHYDNYEKEVNKDKNREKLLEKMKEIGLSQEELATMEEISDLSDGLVPTEESAFEYIKKGKKNKAYDLLYNYRNAHAVFQSNTRKAVMVCWILKKCFKRINCLFSDS